MKECFLFSIFSFLKSKEKAAEFTRQPEEPQENFLDRMTRLAEEGDVDACLTLGYMYLYGENGVARDPERAFKYYSMAAAQGGQNCGQQSRQSLLQRHRHRKKRCQGGADV